jgi:hypothetical protein
MALVSFLGSLGALSFGCKSFSLLRRPQVELSDDNGWWGLILVDPSIMAVLEISDMYRELDTSIQSSEI